MKFLIDSCLPSNLLRNNADTIHVSDVFSDDPGDEQILEYAYDNDYVLITADDDFERVHILKEGQSHNGVVRIAQNIPNEDKKTLIKNMLPHLKPFLQKGFMVFLDGKHMHLTPPQQIRDPNKKKSAAQTTPTRVMVETGLSSRLLRKIDVRVKIFQNENGYQDVVSSAMRNDSVIITKDPGLLYFALQRPHHSPAMILVSEGTDEAHVLEAFLLSRPGLTHHREVVLLDTAHPSSKHPFPKMRAKKNMPRRRMMLSRVQSLLGLRP